MIAAMRLLLAIAFLVGVPVAWVVNLYGHSDDDMHHRTFAVCYGMSCYSHTFLWGTCHFPKPESLRVPRGEVTLAPKR